MDELLQPFPTSFALNADLFVAMSGEIAFRESNHKHRHDFYELVWLHEGNCTFFSDFKTYEVRRGTLIFVSPGQLHDYIVDAGYTRLLIIGFRPNLLPTVAHHLLNLLPFDDIQRPPLLSIPDEIQPNIAHLFSVAHNRFDSRAMGWERIVTTYLRTLLTEAAYLMPPALITQAASASVQLTRAFQQLVEQHYRERIQVQKYADKLGVTSNYLVKTVRETTSMTPKQLLQARLLLESKRLLAHSPLSIAQIGDLLQFPSSTGFTRWFKKMADMPPSTFRQTHPA